MSNSILGHNIEPVVLTTEWEVEIDDDEYEDMEGEMVDEEDIFGYRAIVPKNSNSTTVSIFFYYYAPTSEWYWNYAYGLDYKPVIPVVFACDSDWKLTQCLNVSLVETNLTGHANGWVQFNITLTRKLIKDEKIVFGVYSDILGYVGDYIDDPDTTMCYLYWSRARRRDYASQIAYLSSAEFLQKQQGIFSDYEMCIYMQYENEIESVAYTRTVLGNVRAATGNSRKLAWKRTVPTSGNLTALFTRKSAWKRNATSSGHLTSAGFGSNHLFRAARDSKSFSDSSDKRIFFFRHHEDQKEITTKSYRSNRIKFETSDGFSFGDSLQQLLLIIRSVFSSGGALDSSSHIADYKRLPEAIVDDEELIIRSGDNFRSFSDEVDFEALPFASRLFFRTVQTVMNIWDWLRGKIRETNNVLTFFCPIDLEITIECRI